MSNDLPESPPPYVPLSRLPKFDPRAVPVTGIDTHLPAVPMVALSAQALRQRSGKSARIKEKLA